MDALARQTSGLTFLLTRPPRPSPNPADIVRSCRLCRRWANFNASEKGQTSASTSQTTLRLSAKRHRTLRPLSSSPTASPFHPFVTSHGLDPIPRCTGAYPLRIRNLRARRDSRAGRKFRTMAEKLQYEHGGHLHAAWTFAFPRSLHGNRGIQRHPFRAGRCGLWSDQVSLCDSTFPTLLLLDSPLLSFPFPSLVFRRLGIPRIMDFVVK